MEMGRREGRGVEEGEGVEGGKGGEGEDTGSFRGARKDGNGGRDIGLSLRSILGEIEIFKVIKI